MKERCSCCDDARRGRGAVGHLAHTKEERRGGVGVQILFIRKGKLALKVFRELSWDIRDLKLVHLETASPTVI